MKEKSRTKEDRKRSKKNDYYYFLKFESQPANILIILRPKETVMFLISLIRKQLNFRFKKLFIKIMFNYQWMMLDNYLQTINN